MSELSTNTIPAENTVEDGAPGSWVNANAAATGKKCTQCGAELSNEQVFCPRCGQRNDTQSIGEVSDAIAQYNQNIVKQAKKKKKKTRFLIILLTMIGILVVAFGSLYAFFNSTAEKIIHEITLNNPSITAIQENYEALTPVGKLLFRGKIIDAFVKQVSDNAYTESSDKLVNESALSMYSSFKKIAQALNITEEDGTNVVKHIDAVLKLEPYRKYNAVRACILNSIGDFDASMESLRDAGNASSYYLVMSNLRYAQTHAKNALSAARAKSSGDTFCTNYIEALSTVADALSALYEDRYYSSTKFSTALDTISNLISDISDAEDSVESIVSSIPKITG